MSKRIVIVGAGGHGKVIADIANKIGYKEIIFLDDNINLKKCGCYMVVGTSDDIAFYKGYDFAVGIGNAKIREKILKEIKRVDLSLPVLIHPKAIIAEDVIIGNGTVIMAGTVINPGTIIGEGCIINTLASVDHDCAIADYVHISIGSHIAGAVKIGKGTWVGAGAIINNNLTIYKHCLIGSGAVVINNINESGTYIGVPAVSARKKVNV